MNIIKKIFLFIFLISSSAFSQDFTSSIAKMGYEMGERQGYLQLCKSPKVLIDNYIKVVGQFISGSLPGDSIYPALFLDNYKSAVNTVMVSQRKENIDCEKSVNEAEDAIAELNSAIKKLKTR